MLLINFTFSFILSLVNWLDYRQASSHATMVKHGKWLILFCPLSLVCNPKTKGGRPPSPPWTGNGLCSTHLFHFSLTAILVNLQWKNNPHPHQPPHLYTFVFWTRFERSPIEYMTKYRRHAILMGLYCSIFHSAFCSLKICKTPSQERNLTACGAYSRQPRTFQSSVASSAETSAV